MPDQDTVRSPLHNDQASNQPQSYTPSLRDMLMLPSPYEIKISPDGGWAAVVARTTNWQDNCYENVCYVYDLSKGTYRQVSRSGSVRQVAWVGDQTLALLRQGVGGKAQVWLYEGLVGEGWQVTEHKTGVECFEPFAEGLLFLACDPERDEQTSRREKFGTYMHFEQEESAAAVYYVGLPELRSYETQQKALTEEEAKALVNPVVELSRLLMVPVAIQDFVPSPMGDAIYLNCWPRDDLVYYRETSVYRLDVDAGAALTEFLRREKAKKEDVANSGGDTTSDDEETIDDVSYLGTIRRLQVPRGAYIADVSPDGARLLVAYQGRDEKMFTRLDYWVINTETALQAEDAAAFRSAMENITAPLDRQVLDVQWTSAGIFGTYVDGTVMRLARFSEDDEVTPLDFQGVYPAAGFDIAPSGHIGLVGSSANTFFDVYVSELNDAGGIARPQKLTHFGEAIESWDLGTVETIRWTSRDGTVIEGVLRKPPDFDPSRQYPLVLVVHGGPSWFSSEYLLTSEDRSYYPSVQFGAKGVLVLRPNYRGSIGRGQAFTELNVDNLGVGDLWDLESAVDHLVELGWVDPERVGCMGWSQGGYISAFAGLHSEKFKAVSVGAGISDWYTYHISNDIPDFTIDYLSASPFRDRQRYIKTAPISNLAQAKTPMLIQHGSADRRVPLSNAMELYRGLKAMNVPVELFIYPGMGHPITKPRENHAVMHQNLVWFSHYLLGEPLELE